MARGCDAWISTCFCEEYVTDSTVNVAQWLNSSTKLWLGHDQGLKGGSGGVGHLVLPHFWTTMQLGWQPQFYRDSHDIGAASYISTYYVPIFFHIYYLVTLPCKDIDNLTLLDQNRFSFGHVKTLCQWICTYADDSRVRPNCLFFPLNRDITAIALFES